MLKEKYRKRLGKPKRGPTVKLIKKEVKKALISKSEPKSTASITVGGSAYFQATPFLISSIGQGTLDTNRIGDVVKPLNLYFALNVYYSSVIAVVRLIIFEWKVDTNVLPPTLTYLLEDISYPTTSEFSRDNKEKYRVLVDKVSHINQYKPTVLMRVNKAVKTARIQFNTGGTSGQNHIYAVVLTDNVFASLTSYNARWQIKFLDI